MYGDLYLSSRSKPDMGPGSARDRYEHRFFFRGNSWRNLRVRYFAKEQADNIRFLSYNFMKSLQSRREPTTIDGVILLQVHMTMECLPKSTDKMLSAFTADAI